MFNSKSYYTEEDAILANVEADLSYDGADGLCRAIMESYENERLVESLMDKADAMESRMLSESASEEDIQSLQEASVKSVVQYIIGIMQRFWAKLKGMVMRFIHKVQLWFVKRNLKSFKNDRKKNEKQKGITSVRVKDDDDLEVMVNRYPKSMVEQMDTMKAWEIISSEKILMDMTDKKAKYITTYHAEMNGKSSINKANDGTDHIWDTDEIAKEFLLNLTNADIEYDDIKDGLREKYFEYKTQSESQIVKFLESAEKERIKEVNNFVKSLDNGCKRIIKLANKAKISDNHNYLKALNKVIRIATNTTFRIINAIFGLIFEQIDSYYKAYCKIIAKSVTITLK